MTTDPIQRLLDEHDALMSKFEKLRGAVRLLGERGDAALPEVLPLLREAGEVMNTELIAHARREDEALFAAVEELLGEGWGPTAMMRQEHDDIHGNVERFRETLRGLNEVEHPAIQSGVARLHDQLARGAPAATLRETAPNCWPCSMPTSARSRRSSSPSRAPSCRPRSCARWRAAWTSWTRPTGAPERALTRGAG